MDRLSPLTKFFAAAAAFAALAISTAAQDTADETIADVRAQLFELYGQMESLRRELVPTDPAYPAPSDSDVDIFRRLDGLESELRAAIAKIEDLEFQIVRIAEDGNRQLRDLEFILVELAGKDTSRLSLGSPLGEEIKMPETYQLDTTEVVDQSKSEESRFDAAKQSFWDGDYEAAIEQFEAYINAYPKGKFIPDALYAQGEAHMLLSRFQEAGTSFLSAFQHDESGPVAPEALLRLGESIAELGVAEQACLILREVGARFPDSFEAGLADARLASLDCG